MAESPVAVILQSRAAGRIVVARRFNGGKAAPKESESPQGTIEAEYVTIHAPCLTPTTAFSYIVFSPQNNAGYSFLRNWKRSFGLIWQGSPA